MKTVSASGKVQKSANVTWELVEGRWTDSLWRGYEELWQNASERTPFQHPAWLRAAEDHLAGGRRKVTLRLRRAGQLLAALPMVEVGVPGFRGLWPLPSVVDDVSDPLLAKSFAPSDWRGLSRLSGRTGFRWWPLFSASFLQRVGRASFSESGRWEVGRNAQSLQVILRPGQTWEDFCAMRFSSSERKKLRYESKQLSSAEWTTETDPGAIEPLLQVVRKVERRTWKAEQGRGFFSRPELRLFYEQALVDLAEEGLLRLSTLRLDGQTIACEIGSVVDGVYRLHHTVYDPDAASLSPGRHLVLRNLEQSFREGRRRHEFLQGNQTYKQRLATCAEPLYEATWTQKSLSGEIVRRILPRRRVSPSKGE